MNAAEAHKLTSEEIGIELTRLQRKLFDLRCAAATEKIEDPSQFKKVRRDIARLKTESRARAIKAESKS